jgi:hypothetical protein
MTDEQAEALGRKAAALPGFRWVRGMTDGSDGALIESDEYGMRGGDTWCVGVGGCVVCPSTLGWPDLRDPATLGCVLGLVRERWPLASVSPWAGIAPDLSSASRWRVRDARGRDLFPWGRHGSEAEALVAALEAAS